MTQPLVVGTLVGNPRPGSRTLHAARALSEAIRRTLTAAGRDTAQDGPLVDAALLAPEVFAPGSTAVPEALETLRRADVLVVASPTYKATYTGLLKAVLDRAPADWLRGRTAVPLLVAAADRHALAVEVHLKPLLAELGAAVPGRGLFVDEALLNGDPADLVDVLSDRLAEAGWSAEPAGALR
ncbi:NAD(P)H-dependent oxidoreductase [Saccharothrix australiensis]|uniref:NAD(P)H-dependent FMN reductase n=1 Tax=Saccharothrix australiensis TaxID=2072 RepID=A0A495W9F1_9PSEU|nr:NAD(P)H-dependent oxidoreductase [Saccharothrix australiensis]RKT57375.1 NAD(P)H-dependent FMN reductase [Saccharothrix australiensis]